VEFFYIPLGSRGFLLRAGTFLLGLWGGLIYEMARRRRELVPAHPTLSILLAEMIAAE
jgi:hypothetical protein